MMIDEELKLYFTGTERSFKEKLVQFCSKRKNRKTNPIGRGEFEEHLVLLTLYFINSKCCRSLGKC